MTSHPETTGHRCRGLADLVASMSYEVLPFASTEERVLAEVPTSVPLSITVTEARGLDVTLDLAERLVRHGYHATPHLAARQFVDQRHLAEVIDRLRSAGVRSVFVIGGDAPEPAGRFADAGALLRTMRELDHPFDEVGIGGYPEGHAAIPRAALDHAFAVKAPLATRVVTQICFDARTTVGWAATVAASGVDLTVHIGIPGPVHRRKLARISAGLGLGPSARFLRKQQSLFWRLFLPGGYRPTSLARDLGAALPAGNVAGLHVFTFNELGETERWRRRLLATTSGTS